MSKTRHVVAVYDHVPPQFKRFPYSLCFFAHFRGVNGGERQEYLAPLYYADPRYYAIDEKGLLSDKIRLIEEAKLGCGFFQVYGPRGYFKNIYIVETRTDLRTSHQLLESKLPEDVQLAVSIQKQFPKAAFLFATMRYILPVVSIGREEDPQEELIQRAQAIPWRKFHAEVWEASTGVTLWKTGNEWPLVSCVMRGGRTYKISRRAPLRSFGSFVSMDPPHKRLKEVVSQWWSVGNAANWGLSNH